MCFRKQLADISEKLNLMPFGSHSFVSAHHSKCFNNIDIKQTSNNNCNDYNNNNKTRMSYNNKNFNENLYIRLSGK